VDILVKKYLGALAEFLCSSECCNFISLKYLEILV
jgi:hypothetical protein